MKKKSVVLLIIFLSLIQFIHAQDTIKHTQIITISGGINTNFPNIRDYSIKKTFEYLDYVPGSISSYEARVSSDNTVGSFITIGYKKSLANYNKTTIFLSGNISYKKSNYVLNYSSNEFYNDSSRISGKGTVKWHEHYIIPSVGVTLLNELGKSFFIENNLTFSKDILIVCNKEITFNGTKYHGMNDIKTYDRMVMHNYSIKNYSTEYLLDIYYEFGFGWKVVNNIVIMVDIVIPVINIQKKVLGDPLSTIEQDNNPGFVRTNYNELFFGLKLNYLLK